MGKEFGVSNMIDIDGLPTEIESLSLEEKISHILILAKDKENNRKFCYFHINVIENFAERRDFNSIDQILLIAHKIDRYKAKALLLRSAYIYRKYLKYWHNLRDNTYTQMKSEDPESRSMVGLFEEVRN